MTSNTLSEMTMLDHAPIGLFVSRLWLLTQLLILGTLSSLSGCLRTSDDLSDETSDGVENPPSARVRPNNPATPRDEVTRTYECGDGVRDLGKSAMTATR